MEMFCLEGYDIMFFNCVLLVFSMFIVNIVIFFKRRFGVVFRITLFDVLWVISIVIWGIFWVFLLLLDFEKFFFFICLMAVLILDVLVWRESFWICCWNLDWLAFDFREEIV